jgi:plastocyanin
MEVMPMTRMSVLAAVLALLVSGCAEDRPVAEAPAASPTPTEATSPAPAADVGVIEVQVTYDGRPVSETVKINKDVEQCGTEATSATIVIGEGGGLASTVVSVAGLDGPPTRPTPQLDQRGCQFLPRVVAMQAGNIEILNSDGILHNVHTYSEANPPINKAQPRFRTVMTETFTKPEVIKVTCDVHSWMVGWIAVHEHPYFGVTDERGVVRIEGVPAGTHTLQAWHEVLGRRSQDVTVNAGETTRVVLAFPRAG